MTEAEHITRALHGRWHGRYGTACCPAHGDRNPSLTLRSAPDGRLLAHCHAGCTFAAVLDGLRGLGLVAGTGPAVPPDPADLARRRAAEEAEAAKREAQARAIWAEAVPVNGTLAETYLRGRRITCDLPERLRFHPEAWHGPTARRLPALVARVDGADRFAVHRTYLRADGTGKAGGCRRMIPKRFAFTDWRPIRVLQKPKGTLLGCIRKAEACRRTMQRPSGSSGSQPSRATPSPKGTLVGCM